MKEIDFSKGEGLVPAIVQHSQTGQVLMLGYMNQEALETTIKTQRLTFFSRSKQRLWVKGETSGNYLLLQGYSVDCDADTLLFQALPTGPTCHLGTYSCFGQQEVRGTLYELEAVIVERERTPQSHSYTSDLLSKGMNKVAQKVGEEAVELVIEAKDNNPDLFMNEAADLLFHLLVLLRAKNCSLAQVEEVLMQRRKKKSATP